MAKKKKKKKTGSGPKKKAPAYSLVIVESPSKAKTINKYLGREFKVVASNGHVKDLPKSKLGVDIKDNFSIDLVPISGKKDRIEKIRQMARSADQIYLAPDMDREGEAIAYHLAEEIGGRKKNIHRAVFNAVTKNAIRMAIDNPTALNKEMYESQKTRRILDRLVGYKISPILWDKVQRGISAGRVQSVALRLIVEREDEIKAFIPEQWFSVTGEMKKNKISFEVKYHGESLGKKERLTDKAMADKIVKDTAGKKLKVVDVKTGRRKQNPQAPFTTSKLQQESAVRLGFSAKRTMMTAQRLYEGVQLSGHGLQGLITYMRTDSVRTAPEAVKEARKYIQKHYGKDYLPTTPPSYTKKKKASKVQDAHEAIRPTNLRFTPEATRGDLEADQQKLYELIWNKFIASQMKPALIDQTAVSFECKGHFFRANGAVIKFPGHRIVTYQNKKDEGEEGILPSIKVGEQLSCTKGPKKEEHWTTPPPRYSEASLVKDLEEKGIGRPSTYASIISTIQDRSYVEKAENRFVPTELGSVVCKMLIESFPAVMSVDFTAEIEGLLDKIEDGAVTRKKVLKDFWKDFEATLEKAKEEMKALKKKIIPTDIPCEKCSDGTYVIKWGRNGRFLACSSYPDCTSTYDFKKDAEGAIHRIPKKWFYEPCPNCKKKLEVKSGRYGRFVRCEDYPSCDTTLPYTLPVSCPVCKKGRFVEKQSRYGKMFYGCTHYPDCNYALWSRPQARDCRACGHPIMIERTTKREGRQFQCPECKHKEERKEEAVTAIEGRAS